ncbi:MAG: HAD family phosphatase [Bacteroidales bacterium]|jgi:putative hydrolase of the HAD superfamily|nr:HAD family phosphatase [Bacteroidales bacterium]
MIKNLLLDMGGVILGVDYTRVVSAFKECGIKDFETIYTQSKQLPLIDDFEKGNITIAEFHNGVRDLVKKDLTDSQIDKAWNSMILDVKKDVIAIIGELKMKYEGIYLFSNTNEIHINYVKKDFQEKIGFDVFSCLFNKSYFSNEIHQRKPDKESFQYVVDDSKIKKEETLFIDDTIQNIEGAKAFGMNAYWLTNGETLIDLHNKSII